ncbi:MAG: 3'-5' exonuclease, partial [Rhodanobacteraceae bacterium]
HRLAGEFQNLVVQGGENLRIAVLRHVALWLDFLDQAMAVRDSVLTDALKTELLGAFRGKTDIPETRLPTISSVDLDNLWDLCCLEHAFPHLSTLAQFIRGLKSDELEGLLGGARRGGSHGVVSTIHKVKGLEFDNVIVLPSSTSFGTRGSALDGVERDAAEEARLLYVAMTRAKTHLVYFAGDREYAWAKSPPVLHDGAHGTGLVLTGSLGDVGLGWAIERNAFNIDPDDCQNYIEKQVQIGDAIVLGGAGMGAYKAFMHRGQTGARRQVGFLAKMHGAGTNVANLQVSAVVRYRMDDMDPPKVPPAILKRGWGYVVLVSGRLR